MIYTTSSADAHQVPGYTTLRVLSGSPVPGFRTFTSSHSLVSLGLLAGKASQFGPKRGNEFLFLEHHTSK